MEHPFKDQDLVEFDAGQATRLTGRVVGFVNPANAASPEYGLYIVCMDPKLDEFPWTALCLPFHSLKKVSPLDRLARVDDPCPNCGGESLLTDLHDLSPEMLERIRDEAQGQLDDLKDTWEDANRA
jgi:hypothetical protein